MNGVQIWLQSLLYRKLLGTVVPVSWVAPTPPSTLTIRSVDEPQQLQIVSHCWQYAHLLVYQISSLALSPPTHAKLQYTLYYALEDSDTQSLVRHFDQLDVPNVEWDWQPLPREKLLRRAIGRNIAARASTADWVWFTDCDTLFLDGCIDSLDELTRGQQELLLYPDNEKITPLLEHRHDILQTLRNEPRVVSVEQGQFTHNAIHKAKGAFQIVHGDACRALGYCNGIRLYQTPTTHWRKTFEDTVFRKLLRTEGAPIPLRGLHRIRHVEKGRYAANTTSSKLRKELRRKVDLK